MKLHFPTLFSLKVPCDPILRTGSSWTRSDWRYPPPLDATVICTRQWLLGPSANHSLPDKRFKFHSTKIWTLQNFLRAYLVSSGRSCREAVVISDWLLGREKHALLLLTSFDVHTKLSIDKQWHLCYGCWPPPPAVTPVEGKHLKVIQWCTGPISDAR